MCPISSISDLFDLLKNTPYHNGRRLKFLVLLLLNPNSLTHAGQVLLDNFEYLNLRTEDVCFFLPGFEEVNYNLIEKRQQYAKDILRCLKNGESLRFDFGGFYNSIKWLECHLTGFQYNEGANMIIIDLDPLKIDLFPFLSINLKKEHYVYFNLDDIHRKGNNINQVLSDVTRLVLQNCRLSDIRYHNSCLFSTYSEVNIFIAGSIALQEERMIVKSEISSIQNRVDKIIRCKSVEDFSNSFVEGGRQKQYDAYIRNNADFVIFILDSKVGSITLDEFKVAISAFEETGHPKIFVFNKRYKDSLKNTPMSDLECNVSLIISYCRAHNQYYTDYESDYELKHLIYRSFIDQLVIDRS